MNRPAVSNKILRLLLRIWRILPLWVHVFGARVVRPRYRVGVVAAIFDEQGRLLLFKHTYRKFEWGVPAGGLEYGETPEAAIAREFLEETGIEIEVEELMLATSSREDRHISLIYRCRMAGGDFRPNPEISAMQFFDVGQLPAMLFSEKAIIARLAGMYREIKHELA
jgi:ADP-ribose pyrophosphatase YjhB (NUDIX family)